MPNYLSDEEVFGQPAATTPAAQPASPSGPRFLSDEEVFGTGPKAAAAPQDTLPGVVRYPLEFSKGVGQGLKTNLSQAAEGYSAAGAGFDQQQLDFMNKVDRGEIGPDYKLTKADIQAGRNMMSVDPYGYLQMTPEQRKQFRQQNQATMETPVPKRPLYRAGKALEDFGNDYLGPGPGFEGKHVLTRDIGQGFGSVAGNIATAMIPYAGPGLAAATMLGGGAGQQYQDAVEKGATPEQAARAAQLGTIAGATDLVDVALPMLGTPGKVAGLIRRVGLRAIEGALTEGGQEGLQQFIQNVIAKNLYNPSQDLGEDVGYNALIGAIVGAHVSGAFGGHGHGAETPATEEQIDQAFGGGEPPTDVSSRMKIGPVGTQTHPELENAPPVPRPQDNTGIPTQPAVAPTLPSPDVVDQMSKHGIFIGPDEQLGVPQTAAPQVQEPQEAPLPPASMSPDVVAFLNSHAEPLQAGQMTDEEAQSMPFAPPEATSMAQEGTTIQTTPGVNAGRLARLLGPKLYGDPTNMATVTVKEMFQNAFDAVKAALEEKRVGKGKIEIEMSPATREILIRDNGEGMPTSVMGKEFLEIAGTKKKGSRPSGGLGIAKMLILYGNKSLRVMSMRDGKVAEMNTTGENLFNALEGQKTAPTINVREPTRQDREMFPEGHGTVVKVQIPDTFTDPATGEQKEIKFSPYSFSHPVLQHSPLFDNIDVTLNGDPVSGMGNSFPYQDYTQFANVNFKWGTARIYASKAPLEEAPWRNLHVLSNGLWQFSGSIKKNPLEPYGDNVPVNFYLDVNPKVAPDEAGYPFDLNRQGFSKTTEEDFGQIFKYLSLVYQQAGIAESMDNFGDIQYVTYSPQGIQVGEKQQLKPTKLPSDNALQQIKPGDTVRVEDGKLIVNGREVPELTKDMIEKFRIDPDQMKIPQEQINPRQVILHDNMVIEYSPLQRKSFVDDARERYGRRFDEFVFHLGNAFRELRDIVVQVMHAPPIPAGELAKVHEWNREDVLAEHEARFNYADMKKLGVGISFDPAYRGVHTLVPFQAMYINPILTEYVDPVRAAVGAVGTMVHEIAHHKEFNHNAAFPAEMQRILIALDSNTVGFNFHAFKQKVVNVYNSYGDVFTGLRDTALGGNFNIQPRGKRFKESGSESSGITGPAPQMAESRGGAEGGPGLREWVDRSATASQAQQVGGRPIAEIAPRPTHVDPVRSEAANASAFNAEGNPGTIPSPRQPETLVVYQAVNAALGSGGGGSAPPGIGTGGSATGGAPIVRAYAAHADRMNRFYKWFAGLDQLVRSNKRFIPLLKYAERVREMHNDESKIHDAALRVLKDWRRLGAQGENLTAFINDLANMNYRTQQEVQRGVRRQPTQQEFQNLARRHGLSQEAIQTYTKIRTMFDKFLDLVTQNSLATAQRMISDPVRLQQKLDEINALRDDLKKTPYFPFMNFGRHFVRVNDSRGHAIHFETFERRGFSSAEKLQMARYRELVQQHGAANVKYGLLPEAAGPMVGMPSMLLSDIKNDPNINLTQQQKDALDMLVFMRQAQGSFAARFKNKNYVKGYSMDFQRAFARYFFHGARYYARQKYLWQLRDSVSEAQNAQGNKANSIADYMRDHLQNTILDYTGDFGWAKGFIFLWALGYVPAAATQNLTQTPMITFPFLSGKFGDIRASREIVKAMTKLSSYYRRGRYDNMTDFEARALGYGIKTGRLSETQAPELAGASQSQNLLLGMGGNVAQRGWQSFMEKSSWMFEMAEQFNRRVAYRAALNLALQNPNAKFVQESKNLFADEYQQLVAEFGPQGAAAVVTAANAVDNTQYVYARYARPRVMRGKLPGTLFVFKKYMQSTLFMLAQNKSDVLPRYMIVAAALGGLGGFPGYDDLKSILQALGQWLFKSHFNIDQEIRQYVLQHTNGKIEPDLALHGLARRGFGIPALVDMLGENPGRGLSATRAGNVPFPIIDRSRAIGMGNILPFDVGKMMQPQSDVDKELADEAQQASGAVFSVGFNLYRALQDQKNDWSDFKRWERVMPRALANVSRTYRAFNEGRERGRGGVQSAPTILNYDTRDTEQMMEALALLGGYQPLRLQSKWDTILAKAEVEKYFDMQRDALMGQLFEANTGRDPKEIASVQESIRRFNTELPDWAKSRAITGESALKSMQTRARDKALREQGAPLQKSNAPIDRHIQDLFPEAKTLEIRKAQ